MIKILIGGSPCTHWSIARKGNREKKAEGLGWELFKNYLLAKEKFNPDLFLYENNESASAEIKEQISETLEVELKHINSGLLSAQDRKRFYAFNWQIEPIIDRNIVLQDILQPAAEVAKKYWYSDTPYTFLGDDKRVCATMHIKSMDIGKRVYNPHYQAPTLLCDGGGGHRVKKVFQNGQPRKLTPVEYERLQTLPDGYTKILSDSQRYSKIGNGWTAEVIIHILSNALKNVPKSEKIVVLSMYDGIGTGRYCFDKMGFMNIKYFSYEIDPQAMATAISNYPDIVQCGNAFLLRNNNWKLPCNFSEVEQ